GGNTFAPYAINVGEADAHIKRIISYLDISFLYCCVTHGFTPIIQVIHSDPDTWLDLCRPLPGRRVGCFEKGIVVGNSFVRSRPILLDAQIVGISWRHSQRRMDNGVIFRICPLLHSLCQSRQCPDCLALWGSFAGQEPWFSCCLCITQQMVEKFS